MADKEVIQIASSIMTRYLNSLIRIQADANKHLVHKNSIR